MMFTCQPASELHIVPVDPDRVKFDLLTEFRQLGRVDIGDWIERYPQLRDELLDLWIWLDDDPLEGKEDLFDQLGQLRQVANESLDRACLATSLGSEWLKPYAVEGDTTQLAQEVARLRARRSVPGTD